MRISDWSSDVCSSDLGAGSGARQPGAGFRVNKTIAAALQPRLRSRLPCHRVCSAASRSEEHTSELQSLMRISYAVFCLKKKKRHLHQIQTPNNILYIERLT